MTQTQLAEELGVSLRTVGNWERGESVPRSRMGALIEALGLEDETVPEFGEAALLIRIGTLARQRRGELASGRGKAMSRWEFARLAGIGSDSTIRDFEQGRRVPNTLTLRRLEKALEWRPGAIDEILASTTRKASSVMMEDLDLYDAETEPRVLLGRVSLDDLIDELQKRLASMRGGRSAPLAPQDMYGLAASSNVEHLEDSEDDED